MVLKNTGKINKHKIVHIISNLDLGGAQILLFDILNCLKRKNDLEISVITIDSGYFVKKFIDSGINVINLNEKGLINPGIYFKLRKLLKELDPDIVHTHLNKADFYGRIAAKHSRVPIIFSTCHNYSTTHTSANINKKSIFDRIDDIVINYSDSSLIAISKLVYQYLVNRDSGYKNKTETIYNGLNTDKQKYILSEMERDLFRNELKLKKTDFIILISGRIEKQKGHLFFLKSAKNFILNNPDIKILILGEGSLRTELENFINENSMHDQIRFLGFKEDTEKFIEISDLICVPSLWEGFGLVIIEAMIKGKLVLASNTGGIPEIIENNVNGLLFETENKNDLSEKLNYIYKNKTKFESIKKNAIECVKSKFDIMKNSENYYRLYINKLKIYKTIE